MTQTNAVAASSLQSVTLTIPHDTMEIYVARLLMDRAKRVKLPGFRPGKVPMNIVQQRYLRECIQEAINIAVPAKANNHLAEQNLRVIGEKEYKIEPYNYGQDLVFSVGFRTSPDVTIQEYSNLQIQRFSYTPSQEELEKELVNLKKSFGNYEDLTSEDSLDDQCEAVIKIKAYHNQTRIKSLCQSQLVLSLNKTQSNTNEMEKVLIEHIKGRKIKDEFSVSCSFPKNSSIKEIAGKTIKFDISILEARKEQTKELTLEDCLKNLTESQKEAQFGFIRMILQNSMNEQLDLYHKRMLLDKLAEQYTLDVPSDFVENEFQGIWQHLMSELAKEPQEEALSEEDMQKLEAEYREIAVRRVKLGLVISSIATKEQLKLTEKELDTLVNEKAAQYSGNRQRNVKLIYKYKGMLNGIIAGAVEDLVVKFLIDQMPQDNIIPKTRSELLNLFKGVLPGFEEDEDSQDSGETKAVESSTSSDDSKKVKKQTTKKEKTQQNSEEKTTETAEAPVKKAPKKNKKVEGAAAAE